MKQSARFLILLVVSLALGTLIAAAIPSWRSHFLAPGQVYAIPTRRVEVTVESTSERDRFFVFDAEQARDLRERSTFSATAGSEVLDTQCEIAPTTVQWTTESGRTKTTHSAPGLAFTLTAKLKPGVPGVAEVRWGGAGMEELSKLGYVTIRKGSAALASGSLTLVHCDVAQGDRLAIILAQWTVVGGLPFAALLLIVGGLIFLVPKSPVLVRPQPLEFPLYFPRRYTGLRTSVGLWGGLAGGISSLIAGIVLFSGDHSVDVTEGMAFSAWGSLAVLVLTFAVLLYQIGQLREARLYPEGLQVESGWGRKLLECQWGELAASQALERRKNRTLVGEWLELIRPRASKVIVKSDQIADYPLLRDLVMQLKPQPAVVS